MAWSAPASATGIALGVSVIVTSSAVDPNCPSLVSSEKTRTTGDVRPVISKLKLGAAALASDKVTLGPDTCVQAKLNVSFSGSVPDPSKVTVTLPVA